MFSILEQFDQIYVYISTVYILNVLEFRLDLCALLGALITTLIFWFLEYFCGKSIKIVTLNINDDRRFEGPISDIYPEMNQTQRAKYYKKFIEQTIYNHGRECIFNFSGILPNGIESHLVTTFHMIGYKICIKQYCSDDQSFCYLLAWDPKEYFVKFCEQVYFTKSENFISKEQRNNMSKKELSEECLGVEFEKSMPVYYISLKYTRRQIFFGQFNCGIPNEHKKLVCQKLNKYAPNLYSEIPFVVAGNWNCFDSNSKTPKYYKEMFDELKNYSYISTKDLVEQGETFTLKSYHFDMFRYMTPAQKSEFNNKLESYYTCTDKKALKTEIRDYLKNIISDANKKYKSEIPSQIGVDGLFMHKAPNHISESLIMDMIIGWNLKKATTEKLPVLLTGCEELGELSDHSPLLTIMF